MIILLISCKNKKAETPFSFYYWKQKLELNQREINLVNQSKTLYIKYFDVKWINEPVPVAKIDFGNNNLDSIQINPVVYMTNEVFVKENDIKNLAEKTFSLIQEINKSKNITNSEIQFDCDWTEKTKEKYFEFLSEIKKKTSAKISATIRLHQIKYPKQSGIPPVDKGILMYYNMGKLGNLSKNSIYNVADAALYVKYVKEYPLKLVLALPIFGWAIQMRNEKVINLLAKLDKKTLENLSEVKQVAYNQFIFKSGMYWQGIYFQKNDILALEDIDLKTLNQAATQVRPYLNKGTQIIFFDLDQQNINKFSDEELYHINTIFN